LDIERVKCHIQIAGHGKHSLSHPTDVSFFAYSDLFTLLFVGNVMDAAEAENEIL
jgi:hypothetical protein